MTLSEYRISDPVLPTAEDATLAQKSSQILATYLQNKVASYPIKIMPDTDYQDLIPKLQLPDPDDRHVLAAAIKCTKVLTDYQMVFTWG